MARIQGPVANDNFTCAPTPVPTGACEQYDAITGIGGSKVRYELLLTPEIEMVNQETVDHTEDGERLAHMEILDWSWNQLLDLGDNNVAYAWEIDTNTETLEPISLTADATFLNGAVGPVGPVTRAQPQLGWQIFAPINPRNSRTDNGDVGANRDGQNACWFQGGAIENEDLPLVRLPGPPDDDRNEGHCPWDANVACGLICKEQMSTPCGTSSDCYGLCVDDLCTNNLAISCTSASECDFGSCVDAACNGNCVDTDDNSVVDTCDNDGVTPCLNDFDCLAACSFANNEIDEFVTPSGPIRNHTIRDLDGPDMRFGTVEDLYGNSFTLSPFPTVGAEIIWRPVENVARGVVVQGK